MVKDEINAVISNSKLSMANFKISPDAIERLSILIIDNKHAKNRLILQSLLRVLAGNISISSYSSYWSVENLDGNIISNKSKTEEKIKLEDKIN